MKQIRNFPVWTIIAIISACSSPRDPISFPTTPFVNAPTGATAFFDRDLQRVFNRTCTGGCHESGGTGDSQTGLLLTQDASYDELLDATASKNGPNVIPGDPENSLLVWKLEGKDSAGRAVFGEQMPQGRSPLSPVEIQAIRTWILEGAVRSLAPPVPPFVLDAASLDSVTLDIIFSEELDRFSAEMIGNYVISGEGSIAVEAANLEAPDRVRLTTSRQSPGLTYSVEVRGVQDLTGDEIVAGDQTEFIFTPVISFTSQISPIVQSTCAFVACHTANARFPPGEGLVLDLGVVRENLVRKDSKKQVDKKLVLPGNADSSYLIQKLEGEVGISGDRMPEGGPFLSPAEVQLFRLWIDQGAN